MFSEIFLNLFSSSKFQKPEIEIIRMYLAQSRISRELKHPIVGSKQNAYALKSRYTNGIVSG
jgi:hypothetical protein